MGNPVIEQSMSLINLARPLTEDLTKKIAALFTDEEINKFSRLMLTGCGDSYIAGVATKNAFETLVRIGQPVDALTAPEMTFHINPRKFKYGKALMIGVSISGKAKGTVDAVLASKEKGAFTLGVTEDLSSPLGKAAERILKHDSNETVLVPGTKTYFTSVLSLLLLAIRMGVAKKRFSEEKANEYREAIISYCESFGSIVDSLNTQVAELAKKYKGCTHFSCAGSDMDYASAWFARAKIYEAIGVVTAVENSEDWCHVDYYCRRPKDIGTIVYLSSTNTAKSRTMEAILTMSELERPTIVITDLPKSEFPANIDVITIPTPKFDWIAPLMQFMPMTLLCGYLQNERGEKPLRGLTGLWGTMNGNNIYVPGVAVQHANLMSKEDK